MPSEKQLGLSFLRRLVSAPVSLGTPGLTQSPHGKVVLIPPPPLLFTGAPPKLLLDVVTLFLNFRLSEVKGPCLSLGTPNDPPECFPTPPGRSRPPAFRRHARHDDFQAKTTRFFFSLRPPAPPPLIVVREVAFSSFPSVRSGVFLAITSLIGASHLRCVHYSKDWDGWGFPVPTKNVQDFPPSPYARGITALAVAMLDGANPPRE